MKRFVRGDTVIEVMFSFTVLSMLVVGTYALMNRGMQVAQRSLEITLVRQQIDSQISMIRYIQAHHTDAWQQIRSRYVIQSASHGSHINVTDFVEKNSNRCPTLENNGLTSGSKAFFLAQNSARNDVRVVDVTTSAAYTEPAVFARVDLSNASAPQAQGLFIQVVRSEAHKPGEEAGNAYDVYVNACWDSVGTSVPTTIGTITRIYDGKK